MAAGQLTFLGLVQRLRSEAGVSGADPTTCQNQGGEMLRLVRWINEAYFEIQNKHEDWFFLRQSFAFNTNTVISQQSYTPAQCGIATFGEWKKDSMRIYSTSIGYSNEMVLPYLGWDQFRNLYLYGSMRTTPQKPVLFSIDPSKNFVLGGLPDTSGYSINGEYFNVASYMINDTDLPVIPMQYQMAIVWKALIEYGKYEGAGEAIDRGNTNYRNLILAMSNRQMTEITFGDPLA